MQMKGRKSRRDEHGESANHERYLLTYADLITLLLGLFIILYASAQVDSGKYREYASAISNYFKEDESYTKGGDGVLKEQQSIPQPVLPTSQEKNIDQIAQETEQAVQQQLSAGSISLERVVDGLIIRLSEKLLFESGKAEIQPAALPVLDSLLGVLRGIRQQIIIEGHTDSIPIHTFQFESNWHLSVQRALNIGYYGIRNELPQRNITISGYGAQRPIAPNTTPEGRAANRRVEIMIKELPQYIPTEEGYITSDNKQPSDNN